MGKKKRKHRPDPATLGLPPGGVETHAHLDLEAFDADRAAVLERARAAGIGHLINVFLGPDAYARGAALFADHPWVSFLVGLHPNDPVDDRDADRQLAALEAVVRRDPRVLAVGEIGLDYYWDRVPPTRQGELFAAQLRLAREVGRPVVIHCRDAAQDALNLLDQNGFSGYPLLWHCFGGDHTLAAEILGRGWLLSIPGPVTYPKNDALREVVATLPADRFVLETDCPFLTPEPWRGKRNEPALVAFTAGRVAEVRGEPVADVWLRCAANARRFFGI